MADRKNATSPLRPSAGILRPEQLARYTSLTKVAPQPELATFIEHYWMLSWDLPTGTRYLSSTLPHPSCHLSVERGNTRVGVGADPVVVTGVVTTRFDVEVVGAGWVFGVVFRPGGMAAFTGADASTFRDTVCPATDVFDAVTVAALRPLGEGDGITHCAEVAGQALMALSPHGSQNAGLVARIVDDMRTDRSLLQVSHIEQRYGITTRTLQRLFARHVGVSPKWVLARYRMHDAVTDLDSGFTGTLTDLASRHGWYDQAHFNRDFVRLIGVTPGDYLARKGG